MKLGIIGLGVIGAANKAGFIACSHDVVVHDPKLGTSITDVLQTEVVYLCVPTPSSVDSACDTSIVGSVIEELATLNYRGIVVVRSTVSPGFTSAMQQLFPHLTLAVSPEFLRERCATEDFIKNHNLLAIGTNDELVAKKIAESHGSLPAHVVVLTPTEAELLKYFNNVYAALRITFANDFEKICRLLGCDYNLIKDSYLLTKKSSGNYLEVRDDLRGFSGPCLPKDTRALQHHIQANRIDIDLIKAIIDDNSRFQPTVLPGMRSE